MQRTQPTATPIARALREPALNLLLILLVACTSTPALAQQLEWKRRAPAQSPTARTYHAMAYDSARGVTVLFGGSSGGDETWEWNGSAWTQRFVAGPSARLALSIAYDSARNVTVLYGGRSCGGCDLADTWEWNGTTWTQRMVTGPGPRSDHKMVYDASRGVVVLFGGGFDPATEWCYSDTWEWDGTTWMQRAVIGGPPCWEHAMAYDAARAVTVAYGGASGWPTAYGDTWIWDGAAWTMSPAVGPGARYGHAMTYDTSRNVVIAFGGFHWPASKDDTQTWTGVEWMQLMISGPRGRYDHAMAYDSNRRAAVLFGGSSGGNETWELTEICLADLTGDEIVDFTDYLAFLNLLEAQDPRADFNGDGMIDFSDYLVFLIHYDAGC